MLPAAIPGINFATGPIPSLRHNPERHVELWHVASALRGWITSTLSVAQAMRSHDHAQSLRQVAVVLYHGHRALISSLSSPIPELETPAHVPEEPMIESPAPTPTPTTALRPFAYGELMVRAMVNENGDALFVAKDVCAALALTNPTEALRGLAEDEKITLSNPEGNPRAGIPHSLNVITEPGLYRLIFISRKDEAEAFRRWVLHDVLPAIRKTGTYTAKPTGPRQPAADRIPRLSREYRAALSLAKLIGLEGNAAKIAADHAMTKIGLDAPLKLLGATHLPADHQARPLTPTELGRGLTPPISAVEVNRRLAERGWQIRDATGNWIPTEAGKPHAVLLDAGKAHSNGTPITQLKWLADTADAIQPAMANH